MIIDEAVKFLQNKGVCSFSTDTIYGLGCDATSDLAVQKIYNLKNRDYTKPLAVFFRDIKQAKKYLVFNECADILSKQFIPGQITLILQQKQNTNLSKFLNINSDTLGFRIPNHKFCLELLNKFNKPIAVTSANISEKQSSTTAQEVREYFGNKLDLIIDSDIKGSNIGSTVLDCSENKTKFIRQGKITFKEIEKCLN